MKTNKKYITTIIAAICLLGSVSLVASADCGCGGDCATCENSCPCNETAYQNCDSGCASIPDDCPCATPPASCQSCSFNETYSTPPINAGCSSCSGSY